MTCIDSFKKQSENGDIQRIALLIYRSMDDEEVEITQFTEDLDIIRQKIS